MNEILDGLIKAFQLILSGDPKVYEITIRSLFISGTATLIAILWGFPTAMFLGTKNFRGKFMVKQIFNALLGIPTVALGLILFLAFSRSGPIGFLHLLYTPTGVIIGEAILVTPIVVSLATTAIEAVDPEIKNLAKTLGASDSQASFAVLKESLNGVFLAGIASFNRAVAELGIAQMVGGGIFGWTEVLTTGIAINIARGNIEMGIALGVILLLVVFGTTIIVNGLQRKRK
ncbi:MAG: ABC transporter permease [Candidatus Bathyarchaeia archaeon]